MNICATITLCKKENVSISFEALNGPLSDPSLFLSTPEVSIHLPGFWVLYCMVFFMVLPQCVYNLLIGFKIYSKMVLFNFSSIRKFRKRWPTFCSMHSCRFLFWFIFGNMLRRLRKPQWGACSM